MAACDVCHDYDLWGDRCSRCRKFDRAYLLILGVCAMCPQRGILGEMCSACQNPNKDIRHVAPTYSIPLKAKRNQFLLSAKPAPVKEEFGSVLMPRAMLYKVNSMLIGLSLTYCKISKVSKVE